MLSVHLVRRSPDTVEKERKRQARLPRDDLSRLPQSVARDNVDLNMYSKAEYSMPQRVGLSVEMETTPGMRYSAVKLPSGQPPWTTEEQ